MANGNCITDIIINYSSIIIVRYIITIKYFLSFRVSDLHKSKFQAGCRLTTVILQGYGIIRPMQNFAKFAPSCLSNNN